MRTRYFETGPPDPPDLRDPEQVATADETQIALAILRHVVAEEEGDLVHRETLLRQFTDGVPELAVKRQTLRILAEAFQLLEHARAVCRDLEQSDFFFVTRWGRWVTGSSDAAGELKRRLGLL